GRFIKIDRFSGARLPEGASGSYVVAEFFRDGEEPLFGYVFDGGFAMGDDLQLFEEDRYYEDDGVVTDDTGQSSFGSLSSGGLY
ncbi:MAG: penicillin-binding protein, partial [Pseudomonadota bacterium]